MITTAVGFQKHLLFKDQIEIVSNAKSTAHVLGSQRNPAVCIVHAVRPDRETRTLTGQTEVMK